MAFRSPDAIRGEIAASAAFPGLHPGYGCVQFSMLAKAMQV